MNIKDCSYSEDLVSMLQAASADLFSTSLGVENLNVALLNSNTDVANIEIKKYRNTRNTLAITARLFADQYPTLEKRITSGVRGATGTPGSTAEFTINDLSSAEVNQIIKVNGMDPVLLSSQIILQPTKFIDLVEIYLKSLGNRIDVISPCFAVRNVYSTVPTIKDPFGNLQGFITDFNDFVNSIGAKLDELTLVIQKILSVVKTIQEVIANMLATIQTTAGLLGGIFTSDFGIAEALGLLSLITNILAFIDDIKDANNELTCPISKINIDSLLTYLSTLSTSTAELNFKMYNDYVTMTNTIDTLARNLYTEAEEVSVSNPARTLEISNLIKNALNGNLSSTFNALGTATKDIGLALNIDSNALRELSRSFAAVGVLENLHEQLSNTVDNAVLQLRSKASFFNSNSLNNNFNFNMGPVYAKNAGLIAAAQKASTDETTDQMKDVLRGQIAIAAEKYRDPKKEEVDFIVLRFSSLVTEIQRIYNAPVTPLEDLHNQYREIDRVLSATGNQNTLYAIQSGATRFDTSARSTAAVQASTIPSTTVSSGGIANLPQGTTPYSSFGPVPNQPEGYQFPSYEEALEGIGGILYAPGPSSRISGRAGFITRSNGGGVDAEAMYKLYQLADRWGSRFTIVSAYRSPAANADADGSTGSSHLSGKAFDCNISGRTNQIRFMNLAYQVGFRGFGSYSTFTHIDTSNARDWGYFQYYDQSGPSGAKGT
jgi:hypothetical protein